MAFWKFSLPDGTEAKTCAAALGYSFAAGTTDGPGAFDFTQGDSGDPDANPIWKLVSGLLRTPTREQKECQEPKPVLLDVGEMGVPYAWSPNIVDVQVMRVGQVVIVVSPSEVSTMAGRRWKEAVGKEAKDVIGEEPVVVIGGPANTYAVSLALMLVWVCKVTANESSTTSSRRRSTRPSATRAPRRSLDSTSSRRTSTSPYQT